MNDAVSGWDNEAGIYFTAATMLSFTRRTNICSPSCATFISIRSELGWSKKPNSVFTQVMRSIAEARLVLNMLGGKLIRDSYSKR